MLVGVWGIAIPSLLPKDTIEFVVENCLFSFDRTASKAFNRSSIVSGASADTSPALASFNSALCSFLAVAISCGFGLVTAANAANALLMFFPQSF